MRARYAWSREEDPPQCPERNLFFLPLSVLEKMSEDEKEVLDEEADKGCGIVDQWVITQHTPLDQRRQFCTACPNNNGRWPQTCHYYNLYLRHMHLKEVGLSPTREEYSELEMEAIMLIDGEYRVLMARKQHEARQQQEGRT